MSARRFLLEHGFRFPAAKAVLIIVLVFLFSGSLFGQVKVSGGFLSDSLKIGEETAFYLSAKYPASMIVLFPDSAHHRFSPFEYLRKEYFPTQTAEGIASDSAVYYLTTFEIERTQYLDLPAYVISAGDCTAYRSNIDSVRVIQVVSSVPDSLTVEQLPLKINVAYHPVEYQINYFIVGMATLAFVVVAAVVWIFFGTRISRYFRARRLQKQHAKFVESYQKRLDEVQQRFSPDATESAVSLWKKYLEGLESRPYTKLTSRETIRLMNDQKLADNLFSIDRAIYGHAGMVIEPLQKLRLIADERFSKKLGEVKHGK